MPADARTADAPRVDVVIVSWNVRQEVLACVRSVLASEGVSAAVVVVDNASRDGSAEAVEEEFGDAVRLIRNDRNGGFATAANQGIRAGSSEWVLLLNPDCEVPPTGLARMVARLGALPGHAALAPRLVHADGTPQHSAFPFPSLVDSLLLGTGLSNLLPRRVQRSRLLPGAWDSDEERDVPWVLGAALLVRRETFERVGLLDEGFFMYAEDIEWCERAHRRGLPVRFFPSVEVLHHGNRSGAQAFREDHTAAHLASTLAYERRRHGRAWNAGYIGINAAAVGVRYVALRVAARAGVRAAARRLESVGPAARFYRRRPGPPGNAR